MLLGNRRILRLCTLSSVLLICHINSTNMCIVLIILVVEFYREIYASFLVLAVVEKGAFYYAIF
jgi:hypothetical protein